MPSVTIPFPIPDDVKTGGLQADDRAVDSEHKRAGEVKREQQWRFGHDSHLAALAGRSRSWLRRKPGQGGTSLPGSPVFGDAGDDRQAGDEQDGEGDEHLRLELAG
jgi:hypothetical protein